MPRNDQLVLIINLARTVAASWRMTFKDLAVGDGIQMVGMGSEAVGGARLGTAARDASKGLVLP